MFRAESPAGIFMHLMGGGGKNTIFEGLEDLLVIPKIKIVYFPQNNSKLVCNNLDLFYSRKASQ